jgi:hypothetical protein
MPNPNAGNAGHYHLPSGEHSSDPGGLSRERTQRRLLNYNTPEEQNKRLEGAARKRDIAILKQAALQEIRRLESGAAPQVDRPRGAEKTQAEK